MRHLSAGALRRMLDQPQSFPEEQRAHLEACDRCRAAATTVVGDAGRAALLMEGDGRPGVDPAPALDALRARGLSRLSPSSAPAWRVAGFRSRRVTRPALGLVLVGLMGLMLVGTGVAGNLIKIFEPERVVAVPVDLQTLNSLPDLSRYGTIAVVQDPVPAQAATLDEAAQRTGLKLLAPSTAPAVGAPERIDTMSSGTVSFTFDAAKASAASAEDLPPLPENLDGSSLFVQAGPAVIQTFGGSADLMHNRAALEQAAQAAAAPEQADLAGLLSSLPELMIVQMKSPVVSSDGPSVEDYRDALLGMPNLSPALKAQIEAIGDPSSTLPVPVPVDMATSREVDINGVTGVLVGDNTGVGSGVVWQSGGVVRAVAGTMAEDEVLAIARSMR